MAILDIRQIRDNIYLLTDLTMGFHGNSTLFFTDKGPVLVDVLRDRKQFEEIMDFIRQNGFEKPYAIIYTHWHADHTCGNRTVKDCRIIAHEAAKEHLQSWIDQHLERLKNNGLLERSTRPLLPNETFEDEMVLDLGNAVLHIVHCPGHTHDSAIVYDEISGVLVAGDNIVNKEVDFYLPPVIPPDEIDAKYEELEKVYAYIEGLKPQVLIPGHGSLLPVDEMLEFNRLRYYKCINEGLKFV